MPGWRRSATTTSTATCRARRRSRRSSPGSTCPASTAAAGTTPATTTCASSRRPTRCSASRWPSRRSAPCYDNTTIDQAGRVVEIQRPDGKPDMLQQIEHGVLTVAGSYRALGRFYRGMIVPTLRQYVQVGDFGAQTDNVGLHARRRPVRARPPSARASSARPTIDGCSPSRTRGANCRRPRRLPPPRASCAGTTRRWRPSACGSRWPCGTARGSEAPAERRRRTAPARPRPSPRSRAGRGTAGRDKDRRYAEFLVGQTAAITRAFGDTGWVVGRALPLMKDPAFTTAVTDAARAYRAEVEKLREEDAVRRALRARHLGRRLGHPAVRHAAVLPAHRVPGDLPEGVDAARAGLRAGRATPGRTRRRSCRAWARGRSRSATG